jgi:hypothetical protein
LETHTLVVAAVVVLGILAAVLAELVAVVMAEDKPVAEQMLLFMAVAVAVVAYANLVQTLHTDMHILALGSKASAYSVTQEVK